LYAEATHLLTGAARSGRVEYLTRVELAVEFLDMDISSL